jgi:hypothetical protein
VPDERNVYHEREHGIVHVLVVDLHRGGHHLREQPNGSDVLRRPQQVQVRECDDALHCHAVMRSRCRNGLLLDRLPRCVQGRPDVVRQWQPRDMHADQRLLRVWHTGAVWTTPNLYWDYRIGSVHVQRGPHLQEPRQRLLAVDRSRLCGRRRRLLLRDHLVVLCR